MTKVTAEHFRAMGAKAFADGEVLPRYTGTWQARARVEGWDEAHRAACAAKPPLDLTLKCADDVHAHVDETLRLYGDGDTVANILGLRKSDAAVIASELPGTLGLSSEPPSHPTFGCTVVDVFNPSAEQPKARVIVGHVVCLLGTNDVQSDTRPCAYLERNRFGKWSIREEGTDAWIHAGVKRKTHARNVAARMGYRIVDAPL